MNLNHFRDWHVDAGSEYWLRSFLPGEEDSDLVCHPELTDTLHQRLQVVVEARHQHGHGDVRLGQSGMFQCKGLNSIM